MKTKCILSLFYRLYLHFYALRFCLYSTSHALHSLAPFFSRRSPVCVVVSATLGSSLVVMLSCFDSFSKRDYFGARRFPSHYCSVVELSLADRVSVPLRAARTLPFGVKTTLSAAAG